jgi:RHS repeat-associated protein
MKYSDPDGDNGSIAYTVYSASGTIVQSGSGATVVSGADSIWYSTTSFATGQYHWTAVATDSKGLSSGMSGPYFFTVNKDPSAPGTVGDTPANASSVPTVSPTLSLGSGALASDPEGDTVGYMFSVYQGTDCTGTLVAQSVTWSTSSSWTVPSDKLQDATPYAWCVQSRDFVSKAIYSWSTSSPTTFTVNLPKLGSKPFWPMWHGGALQVNESTGNLVLALPGPSFPTAAGTLGVSFIYNLLDSRPTVFGSSGPGWTFADSSGAPAKLIDHSNLSPAFDSVERVEADGSSVYYGHVSSVYNGQVVGTGRYTSPAGDTSVLTKDGTGAFQLNDPDGSTYSFTAPDATGTATLTSAQVLTANGHGKLTYTFTSGKLTLITASGNASPDGQAASWQPIATLSLRWAGDPACAGALVCVTGPDGQTWKYVGSATGGTSGDLQSVFDGTRTLLQIGYDANSRPNSILNADDLDPNHASPGYASNHSIVISYLSGRTYRIADTNVHSAAGSALQTRTTQFDYHSGDCPGVSLKSPQQTHSFSRSTFSYGCTEVTSPMQFGQPTPQVARAFYDVYGHPLEIDSPLQTSSTNKNFNLYAYDSFNTLEWAEDGNGDATDNSYSTDTHVLTQTQAPDPQMSGLGRPTVSYRYDEAAVGSATTVGTALTGLQGRYYSVADFSQPPAGVENDATVDSTAWGSPISVPFLNGQTTNFAVRWSGEITIPSGDRMLATVADGGTRVTVDGSALVIDKWSGQSTGAPVCSGAAISAGTHQIVVDYNEGGGSASVKLEWAAAGAGCTAGNYSVVPTANLQPEWLNQTSTVSPADIVGGAAIVAFTHYPATATQGASAAAHTPDYSLRTVGSAKLITSYSYDVFGRLIGKVLPNGNSSATTDPAGNLSGAGTASTSNWGTTYSYYGLTEQAMTPGTVSGTSCPGTATVSQLGLPKTVSQHGLHDVTTVYDAAGRPVSVTNGKGASVSCYDAEGRLIATLAAGDSQPTVYSYDPSGAQLAATHAGPSDDTSGTVTSSYNEAGELLTAIDANGAQATYSYDADGNRVARSVSTSALTFGPTAVGSGNDSFASDRKRVNGYTISAAGAVTKLSIYLQPTGTSGTQLIRGVLYQDSSGSPGALAGKTLELAFHSTDAAGWYDLVFPTPVPVTAGKWWIGVITGTTSNVAEFHYSNLTNGRFYNSNSYSAGPTDPFGTATIDSEQMSLYATYTLSTPTAAVGTTTVGGSSDAFAADKKRVNGYTFGCTGSISKLSVYLSPTATSGTQVLKGVVYQDSSGQPGTLAGVSNQISFHSTDAAGWYDLTFPSGIAVSKGKWWIGVITGATGGVAGFRYTTVANSRYYNTNSYTAGPSDPFGTGTAINDGEQMSLYATENTPGGYCSEYTYNAADQLTGQTDPAGRSYGFFYDDRGNLRATQYPNGTFSWTDTNGDGWTVDTLNRAGTVTAATTTPPAGAAIAEYVYSYAPDGRKLSEQLSGPASQTTTYSYDEIGRLLTYSISGGTSAKYCYDLDSNRLQVVTPSTGSCIPTNATYSYTPGTNTPIDALTAESSRGKTYTYDGAGSALGDGMLIQAGSDTYRYDGLLRLRATTTAGASVCYRFGPDGGLTGRVYDSTGTSSCTTASSTTNYLLGDLLETNGAGAVTASYQDGPAGNLASFNGPPTTASTPTYLYYNGHGDLAAEANSAGTRTAAHSYDPFGTPLDTLPANTTTHRYTGAWDKQDDATNGLILMGARPYDPTLGRFLSVDPIDGGSLNNYDYAGQDPINGYDLDGTVAKAVDDGSTIYSEGVVDACNAHCVVKTVVTTAAAGASLKVGLKVLGLFGRALPPIADHVEVFRTALESLPESLPRIFRYGGAAATSAIPDAREAVMSRILSEVYPHVYRSEAAQIRALSAWLRVQQRVPR